MKTKVVVLLLGVVALGACSQSEFPEDNGQAETPVVAAKPSNQDALPDMDVEFETAINGYNVLRGRKELAVSEVQGWKAFDRPDGKVRWLYSDSKHPAHPTVIRQVKAPKGAATPIETQVLCDAGEVACREAFAQIDSLNQAWLGAGAPTAAP